MVKKSNSTLKMSANPWIPLLLILAVTLAVYSNTYRVPFVFDGKVQIEKKEKIRDLSNYGSFEGFKSRRPLVEFTFALNYRLGGLNPVGYHLVNILIHLTNGFLIYFLSLNAFGQILRFEQEKERIPTVSKKHRKGKKKKNQVTPSESEASAFSPSAISFMSMWVALIFVVHPIQTQAVTYMVQRYASMSAMFYLVSVLLYVKGRKLQLKRKDPDRFEDSMPKPGSAEGKAASVSLKIPICFIASVLAGICAFFSKESAATLPGILLLVEYFLFDRSWSGWKKKLLWIVPTGAFLAFLGLYFLSSMRGLRLENLLEDVSVLTRETRTVDRWHYLFTQFSVLVRYVQLLFFPIGQNIDHMYPFKEGFFDGLTPLAFISVLAIVLLGIWNIRKRAAISFGIFWFFITLSIESSIFPISDAMFEHRLYLPVFGFAFTTVYLVFALFRRKRIIRNLFLVSALIGLGIGTYLRNSIWQDPLQLWSDSIQKNPNNYRARNNLGAGYNDRGELNRAVREFSKALKIRPDFADANNNLGNALIRQGQFDEAVKYLGRALRRDPRSVGAHNNMGVALASKGDLDGAIRHFKRALRRNPRYAKAHNSLGNVLAQKGQMDQAMAAWSKAAELNPLYAEPHYNMGLVFLRQGKVAEAKKSFSQAVRINPGYAQAYSQLGFISAREGAYEAAVRFFSKALEINPRLADAQKGFQAAVRLSGKRK